MSYIRVWVTWSIERYTNLVTKGGEPISRKLKNIESENHDNKNDKISVEIPIIRKPPQK